MRERESLRELETTRKRWRAEERRGIKRDSDQD